MRRTTASQSTPTPVRPAPTTTTSLHIQIVSGSWHSGGVNVSSGTRVVLDERPLNGCVRVCVCVCVRACVRACVSVNHAAS